MRPAIVGVLACNAPASRASLCVFCYLEEVAQARARRRPGDPLLTRWFSGLRPIPANPRDRRSGCERCGPYQLFSWDTRCCKLGKDHKP